MKFQAKYSIGDMSRICNISKKALRYYDKIGLITTQRQDYNNYRYYTYEALLSVPVIKYYKQMGFTLEEMRAFIEGDCPNVYSTIQKSFLCKIKELETEQEAIRRKHASVNDWYDMVLEAEMVLENNIHEVSVKYIEPKILLFQEQEFDHLDIKGAIINIGWTNYIEDVGNEITGAVMINFSSFAARMNEENQTIKMMQETLLPCQEGATMKFGGCMMATCYHLGPHDTIHETYKRIGKWCRQFGYQHGEESFERYVADYWLTSNSSQFVTEVMVKVSRARDGGDADAE